MVPPLVLLEEMMIGLIGLHDAGGGGF